MDRPGETKKGNLPLLLLIVVVPPLLTALYLRSRNTEPPEAAQEKPPIFDSAAAPSAQPDLPSPPHGSLALAQPGQPTGASPSGLLVAPEAFSPAAQTASSAPRQSTANEKEFLRAHDAQLKAYQERLRGITRRYHAKYPMVRKVDHAFGNLPRYMAVKEQYGRDRDAYKWARNAIALPEVRALIKNYASSPEVWQAAIGMMLEALKNPPPPEIRAEVKRFLADEPVMQEFMADFSQEATKHVAFVPQVVDPTTDLTPLTNLVQEMSPASRPGR